MDIDTKTIWREVLESIKVFVSPAIFSTWFSQTHLASLKKVNDKYVAEVGCPSPFIQSTVEQRYFGIIQDSLSKNLESSCDLLFIVKEPPNLSKGNIADSPLFTNPAPKTVKDLSSAKLRYNFTFSNFAVSSSNQMAWAACEAVSKNPGTAYNPLFLWGGVGVGKTHLMNSVGYEILNSSDEKKVYYCTGEDFTNDIVEGIRNKSTQAFRNKYRKLDLLMIDDIQFIAGKDAVQEEFFHTFNAIVSAGGQIILTSDRPPSEISKLEERLRSRFEAGLIIDISPPDFELKCAITQIKAGEKGIALETEFVHLIAGNTDSARKIEGVLTRIVTEINLNKLDSVTEEVVTRALGKNTEQDAFLSRKVSTDDVMIAVCKHYSISKKGLMSPSRVKNLALPRQILMYLLRKNLNMPLQEVGMTIGGRDHTTVMHAVDKITRLASNNVQIREDISGIKKILWG